eukprot:172125_1
MTTHQLHDSDFVAVCPWMPLGNRMHIEKRKRQYLLICKHKCNGTWFELIRPMVTLTYTESIKPNCENCQHNMKPLFKPMYLSEFFRKSGFAADTIAEFSIAHQTTAKYIDEHIIYKRNNKTKTINICKQCAIEILLETQGLRKLIYELTYMCMDSDNTFITKSLRMNHIFYCHLLISFIIYYPNIKRFIFKELDESLQKPIIQLIIATQSNLDTFLALIDADNTNFWYSFRQWDIIRKCLRNLLPNTYKYWHGNCVLFDNLVGKFIIQSAVECFKEIMDYPEITIYHSALFDAYLTVQCMTFKRDMIPCVYELF